MKLEEVLEDFDRIDKKGFNEHDVSNEIRKALPENINSLDLVPLAEYMAFNFHENHKSKNSGWGTYFGPTFSHGRDEFPSLSLVTHEMLDYWKKRTNESKNPILVARYSGLIWDFEYKIDGNRPSHAICRLYIEALLNVASGHCDKYPVNSVFKLQRALELSIGLNDEDLIEKCKQVIVTFEKEISIDDKPGTWGYSFDLLVGNKKVKLTSVEEVEIITELEEKLKRLTSRENGEQKIDPWSAEAAAKRLATYYKKKLKDEDVKRVLLLIGVAYNSIISEAAAMQASGWLEDLYKLYTRFNLNSEAEEVLVKIRELGPKVAAELKPISHSIEIPKEKIQEYINEMTSGTLAEVLARIAFTYIPIKEQAKEEIFKLSKNDPILFLVRQQLQDDKGRVTATLGSLEDDLEGHIVRQVSQNLSFSSPFLYMVITESIKKFSLSSTDLLEFMSNSPIKLSERIEIFERGLRAYFENDYLTFIHLFIPQIEEAIRNIVEFTGGNILKPSRGGGFNLKTFDDLLRDEKIIKGLGEDFANYFKVLFTDTRGWNLRNKVCHGIANPNHFNPNTANRVLHAFLCLGLIRKKEG